MSALVAAGCARSRFQSVSVVPMIQWLPHGMTNITDFSVRRMIATSLTIRSRGTTMCTPLDARTWNRPRCRTAPGSRRSTRRCVDHDVAADLGDRAVLGVAHAHADHPVALAQQRHHLGGAPHHRAVMRGGAGHRHGVPGVVDDGVVVADAADQRAALQARAQPQRAGAGQMLLRRNGFRAAEAVVEEDARRDVRAFPPAVGQREQERQRLDQMRRQPGQRQLPLVQRLAHQPEFQLLEVAQAAVEHLRRPARRARGEVARLDQRHLEPAGGGVQRAPGTHHAAADDHDVELLGAEPLPGRRALLRVPAWKPPSSLAC